jgi:two-component system cell cycle sensor histidine kinase/response regulator CckA
MAPNISETLDQFQVFVEAVKDYAIFLLDPAGKIVSWNTGAEWMKGYKADEIIGKNFSVLYTAEDQRQDKPFKLLEIAASEGRVDEEGWRVRKDGSRFWANVVITAIRDGSGALTGFGKVTRDLTERKHAEDELRAGRDELERRFEERTAELVRAHESLRVHEERFRHMIEGVKDYAIFTIDPDGRVTSWNKGAEHIYGYTPDEIIGQHRSRFFTPEDVTSGLPMSELRVAAETGRISEAGWRVRKDGSQFWANGTMTVLRDEAGGLRGFVKIVRDLTERQQIETELRKTMDALQLRDRAMQAVTQGILITDPNLPDNPIVYASPGFERMTGYRAEEVVGRNCRFLQGPKTDLARVRDLRGCIRAGRECAAELLNYRKDGTPFWNALFISPVRENGALLHYVGVQADVTERRNLEEQVRQAQKMEAVGQLAGGVAHDFNNLLTIINGYSELMLTSLPPGDPMKELLTEVAKAGERAGTLIRQLLVFSRQQVIEPKVLDLNAVVSDTEKMLRRLIGEDVRLATRLDPALGPVKADPGQIEQVIVNLCVNARDAMPTGGQLTVETGNVTLDEGYARTHAGVRPGDYSMLAVSDTGTGLDEATKARIFEPFFTTKGPGKGTGLGLAVVHGVVQQGGGHVEVHTELGQGTTFKVYLPQVRERVASGKSSPNLFLMPKGAETVLLVEDEVGVRALARHILSGCGYTVLEAGDGREAVRLVEAHTGPLHLLASDVVMPNFGGRQLAERVDALRPGIKVLFLSGYTDDAVVRHGVLEADFAFLQKPFTPSGLAVKVRDVLDAK